MAAGSRPARPAPRGRSGVPRTISTTTSDTNYVGAVSADLLLVCGVFGNIGLDDIENTIRHLRSLSAVGGTVIWTRHPRQPGGIDDICRWFAEEDYELASLDVPEDNAYGVGVHRLCGEPVSLQSGRRLFSFLAT